MPECRNFLKKISKQQYGTKYTKGADTELTQFFTDTGVDELSVAPSVALR